MFDIPEEDVQLASPALIDAVGDKRIVVFAQPGSGELRALDLAGADGSAGGENWNHIILRRSPPLRITILEEFLHGTQSRLGKLNTISNQAILAAEVEVKKFMIRHRALLGLNDADVTALQGLLEDLFNES
jgi:hypothetical protein